MIYSKTKFINFVNLMLDVSSYIICVFLFTVFPSMFTESTIKVYKIVYSSTQVTKGTLTQWVKQYEVD